MKRALVIACSLACATPALAQPASDDPRSPARDLATLGVVRFDAGDFEDARDLFHRAYQLVPAPSLLLRECHALDKLHRLIEAEDACARTAAWKLDDTSPDAFRAAVAQAKEELPPLHTRIPRLRVVVLGGASLDVRVDSVRLDARSLGVPRLLDPGVHKIEVRGASSSIASETIVLSEADDRTIELRAGGSTPAPAPSPTRSVSASTWRTIGWTSLGVGAAGLVLGVTSGLVAASKKSTLDDQCPGGNCPSTSQSDVDSFRTWRSVSTVGYVVGLAGAAAGVTILLTKPGASERGVSAYVGPSSVGMSGRF